MPVFQHLILNGRPNAGKTDFTDFIRGSSFADRSERYHIGDFIELDDFEWLWEKFIEDDIWESIGYRRLYSHRVPGGYVQNESSALLEFLIAKFNHIIHKDYLSQPEIYNDYTLFLEFARGRQDGGIRRCLEILSPEILSTSAILHLYVSYAESRRKNEQRPHPLPEESLVRFSADLDWSELSQGQPSGYITVKDLRVPFVTVVNEPEDNSPAAMQARYSPALQELMRLYQAR